METPIGSVPLRIAICEDVASEADRLVALINDSDISADMQLFSSGEAFVEAFQAQSYDLIFLDVYMDVLSGVQVAEHIRESDNDVVIVFITSSEDFTRESYRLNAYKYIIKPVSRHAALDALDLARVKRDRAQGATIQIVCDGEPVTLPLSNIVFVEAKNRRSVFYMTDDTSYATLTTIDALEKLLPPPRFLRSHRAFIVNFDHVVDVDEDFVMDNGMRAYIRVKDHRRIKHLYDDYLFNSIRSDL